MEWSERIISLILHLAILIAIQHFAIPLIIICVCLLFALFFKEYIEGNEVILHMFEEGNNDETSRVEVEEYDLEWLNHLIKIVWQEVSPTAFILTKQEIWPIIDEKLSDKIPLLKDIELTDLDIGLEPVKIKSIGISKHDQTLILDCTLSYFGSAHGKILLKNGPVQVPVGLKDIRIEDAKIRLIVEHESDEFPFISKISFTLLETPKWDFDLTNMGGIANLPGFDWVTAKVVGKTLTNQFKIWKSDYNNNESDQTF